MKTAIFDMDGTLLDSMWMWRTVLGRFLKEKAVPGNAEIGNEIGHMTFTQAMEYVTANYDVGYTRDELMEQLDAYILNIYRSEVTLKPYVREYLTQLKEDGVHICLATLTGRHMVETALEHVGIREFFDFIITVEEIGKMKTEPDIYEACLEHFGTAKEDAVVFEDAAYCLVTAHNAGFVTYGIEDPWQDFPQGFEKEYCDRFITSYAQLLKRTD